MFERIFNPTEKRKAAAQRVEQEKEGLGKDLAEHEAAKQRLLDLKEELGKEDEEGLKKNKSRFKG